MVLFLFFLFLLDWPTSLPIWEIKLGKNEYKIQFEVANTFLTIFGGCMNISFNIKVKILVLRKWSYSPHPPPLLLCWQLSLVWLSYVEHAIHSLLSTYLEAIPNNIPLAYRCPNNKKKKGIRGVSLKMCCGRFQLHKHLSTIGSDYHCLIQLPLHDHVYCCSKFQNEVQMQISS